MSAVGLLLPQWQGYAVDDRPGRGARQIAAACGVHERFHAIAVPDWHDVTREAGVLGLGEIVEQAAAALRWLDGEKPSRLLTIGGDCGSDLAPIVWQAARSGSQLGVLYLDAHGDLNTPASSPSGRFHGMILRAALGEGAPALIALQPSGPAEPLAGTERSPEHRAAARGSGSSEASGPAEDDVPAGRMKSGVLAADQVIMAGVRDLDPGERDFLAGSRIQRLPVEAIGDGDALAAVLAHPAIRWHVHFDLDVLDPGDFPDVTMPTPGGTSLRAVTHLLVELVARRDVVGITVTEHVGGEASARRIADLLVALRRAGWR